MHPGDRYRFFQAYERPPVVAKLHIGDTEVTNAQALSGCSSVTFR